MSTLSVTNMTSSLQRAARAKPRMVLQWIDIQRVAVEASVAANTVLRWCKGEAVHATTNRRIMQTINKLGLTRKLKDGDG